MTEYTIFNLVHDVIYLTVLTSLNAFVIVQMTAKFANQNNVKKESRENSTKLENKVQELTLEAIKSAIRDELALQLNTVNGNIKSVDEKVIEIKQNQSNLVTELRTLGVIKETPVLK
jgi:hypothetical protein